jgi:phosphatidate cytidylyltransferase
MLRWRLPLGILIAAALLGLCWLDGRLEAATRVAGIALFPVLIACVILASREMLRLAAASGMRPVPWAVYGGSLLVVTAAWLAPLGCQLTQMAREGFCTTASDPALLGASTAWTSLALGGAVMLAFLAEMRRYRKPGGATASVALAVFTVVYLGLLPALLIQLRLRWGLWAVLSLLIVVKMADTGAYAVGRLIGRNPMAPGLSPGKTIEGAIGALLFACGSSWATFRWLVPGLTTPSIEPTPWWGWLLFGLLVGAAGMIGDLAESLIKRDFQSKDSSNWVPGFGGVLDLLDSVLLAAPVAYACWSLALVR